MPHHNVMDFDTKYLNNEERMKKLLKRCVGQRQKVSENR